MERFCIYHDGKPYAVKNTMRSAKATITNYSGRKNLERWKVVKLIPETIINSDGIEELVVAYDPIRDELEEAKKAARKAKRIALKEAGVKKVPAIPAIEDKDIFDFIKNKQKVEVEREVDYKTAYDMRMKYLEEDRRIAQENRERERRLEQERLEMKFAEAKRLEEEARRLEEEIKKAAQSSLTKIAKSATWSF